MKTTQRLLAVSTYACVLLTGCLALCVAAHAQNDELHSRLSFEAAGTAEPLVVLQWADHELEFLVQEAAQEYEGCAAGVASECHALANRYYGGIGTPRRNELAAALVDHSCRSGHAVACYDMGARYMMGVGVVEDIQRATIYFEEACDADVHVGCYMLGRIHADGLGTDVNFERAAASFARSCELGFEGACGYSVPIVRDIGRWEARFVEAGALDLVGAARACDHAMRSGCYAIAVAAEERRTQLVTMDEATALIDDACEHGHLPSCLRMPKPE